jgi:hypothetical protein
MKIDPQTFDLFTDSGEYLKTLFCPRKMRWEEMKPTDSKSRMCESCSRNVYDTATLKDSDLQQLLQREPEACLSISITQDNCTVLPRRIQNKHMDGSAKPAQLK